jgi:DNA anti-recombination protein RmuC
MDMVIVGALALIAALIVGEIAWVVRGREFSALCRQIDDLNRKLADAESQAHAQKEGMNEAQTNLAAANARLEALARLERELQVERTTVSDLKCEIASLATQLRAGADAREAQVSLLSALRTEIAGKFETAADEVLKSSAKEFLSLACRSLEAQQQAMGTEISGLLMPLSASLAKFESALASQENVRRERHEKWAEITTIGKDLHPQLRTVGDHVNGLGMHLDHVVHEFNEMIGRLEASVMPQTQRLHELTIEGTAEPVANLKLMDRVVRLLRPTSDGDQEIVAAD